MWLPKCPTLETEWHTLFPVNESFIEKGRPRKTPFFTLSSKSFIVPSACDQYPCGYRAFIRRWRGNGSFTRRRLEGRQSKNYKRSGDIWCITSGSADRSSRSSKGTSRPFLSSVPSLLPTDRDQCRGRKIRASPVVDAPIVDLG